MGVTSSAAALTYEVALGPSGAAEIDEIVPQLSLLVKLQQAEAPDAFVLVARARNDAERLEDAARSLGYYGATVDIHVDGRPIQDPELIEALERGDQTRKLPVDITIAAGPAYRLRHIAVEGLPAQLDIAPILVAGAVAKAADVLRAEEALREELRTRGYAFATIPSRNVVIDHAQRSMDVVYTANPGPPVEFGDIRIAGLAEVDEGFARARLGLKPGERFDSKRLEAARAGLAATGVFSSVRTQIAGAPDQQGRVPVTFDVIERAPRSVSLGGGYSTDEGVMLNARWTHRNLFGQAETLRLSAEINGLLHDNVEDAGGRLDTLFRKPDFLMPDLALRLDAGLVREQTDAYDRDAAFTGAALERRFGPRLVGSFGTLLERSRITQEGDVSNYTLLAFPGALTWDGTDNKLEPTTGLRANLTATPTTSIAGTTAGYLALRAGASFYLDIGDTAGRTILATRGTIGTIFANGLGDVPADRRFYAGGGGSVRGYAYQSIGPRNSSDQPTGGLSLVETSIELRQRIGEDWGAAIFIDAGGVAESSSLGSADLRAGVGAGVRYYTQLGAIRFDVGVPLRADSVTGRFQVYIGIGQAF